MDKHTRAAVMGIAVSVLAGMAIMAAGSQGSVKVGAFPLFAVCGALSYLINWTAFVPSFRAQTERFYDLTGSASYLTLTGVALVFSDRDGRAVLVSVLVAVWALRLGSFLFRRVSRDGGDGRFDEAKPHPIRFLMFWSVQALWVLLTLAAALAAITGSEREPLGLNAFVGATVWLIGFGIESVADQQKSNFRANPANHGKFITTGLWAWSRHPNYFGEIVLWIGVAIVAVPVLSGWRWVTMISPVFVYLLLTRVSGIPLLESRAKRRWGDDPEFQTYKKNTPSLLLRPPPAKVPR